MQRGDIIYQGKAKIIYSTDDPSFVIQYFKDDVTAFNKEKFAVIEGKGVVNSKISAFIMRYLASQGITTHFEQELSDREHLIRKLSIFPVEFVVRNYAAGTLVKRYPIADRSKLDYPLTEFFLKNDSYHDPLIAKEHIMLFNLMTESQFEVAHNLILHINDLLIDFFRSHGLILADFKIELGVTPNHSNSSIFLADEITPDSCRLWDESMNSLDKDIFRFQNGDLLAGYTTLAKRIGVHI